MNAPAELETVRDWLRYAVSRFGEAQLAFGHGTTSAYDEAAYLVLHALHLPLDRLEPFLDARLTSGERAHLANVFARRVDERVPAAYLTHEAWLGDFRFYVDERVIIPRSYIAELLPDGIAPYLGKADNVTSALDLCTGSGCLAILLAHAYPRADVDALDISSDALAGGEDGLDAVRTIIKEAPRFMQSGATLVMEIGANRAAAEAAFPRLPFVWLETPSSSDSVFLVKREDLIAGR